MQTLKPANVKIQLRQQEATFLLMVYDAGLIQLSSFDAISKIVFGMKGNEEKQKEFMNSILKLKEELLKQIYPPKSSMATSELVLPDSVK